MSAGSNAKLTRFGWFWLGSLLALAVVAWLASRWDDTTQIFPDQSGMLEYCFIAAVCVAVASTLIGITQSTGPIVSRIIVSVLGFGAIGALSTLFVSDVIGDLVSARIYFPADKTQNFHALMPIGRAYRTDSRFGSSWIIQPTPLWTNINITQSDYDLMAAHNGSMANGKEPEDVPVHGYFCARVTLQIAGSALLVLHAGNSTLPPGSVVVCPPEAAGKPFVQVP